MKPIVLTYYLPQFHEVEENNLWWGKGFTEWTNLRKAKKYFNGHEIRKPTVPLGEYDLMMNPEIMQQQYNIAEKHGIDGFLVWNYWFGNDDKILEKPLEKVLDDNIQVKYAFTWANHSWLNKTKGILLKEQKYLGVEDYEKYFEYLKPYFLSENYIKKDNKPIFGIFMPKDIPDIKEFINCFESKAKKIGFDGIFWLAENTSEAESHALLFDRYYDSVLFLKGRNYSKLQYFLERLNTKTKGKINFGPFKYDYKVLAKIYKNYKLKNNELGVVFTGWDTSIRHAKNGIILKNFGRDSFKQHLEDVFNKANKNSSDIVIIKSWNEWAEGNVLEPDNIFGTEILNVVKELVNDA